MKRKIDDEKLIDVVIRVSVGFVLAFASVFIILALLKA